MPRGHPDACYPDHAQANAVTHAPARVRAQPRVSSTRAEEARWVVASMYPPYLRNFCYDIEGKEARQQVAQVLPTALLPGAEVLPP